jgi:hypothetical protein
MRKMATAGLIVRLSGNGVVVSQDPSPGEALVEGAMATLTLERSGVGVPPALSGQ